MFSNITWYTVLYVKSVTIDVIKNKESVDHFFKHKKIENCRHKAYFFEYLISNDVSQDENSVYIKLCMLGHN